MDVAPTALKLFGLEPPAHMEGRPLFEKSALVEGERDVS
jgi:arylsulfatase A-like enzyme